MEGYVRVGGDFFLVEEGRAVGGMGGVELGGEVKGD